jgi:hypothetical protein
MCRARRRLYDVVDERTKEDLFTRTKGEISILWARLIKKTNSRPPCW